MMLACLFYDVLTKDRLKPLRKQISVLRWRMNKIDNIELKT